jgi:hypothetical protein
MMETDSVSEKCCITVIIIRDDGQGSINSECYALSFRKYGIPSSALL